MNQYYIVRPGFAQEGPYSASYIQTSYLQGEYPPGTMLWNESMPEWTPIEVVFAASQQEPAQPGQSSVDYFVAEPGVVPHGPYSLEEVMAKFTRGAYPEGTRAWSSVSAGWAPIESIIPASQPQPATPAMPVIEARAPQPEAAGMLEMPPIAVPAPDSVPAEPPPAPQEPPAPEPALFPVVEAAEEAGVESSTVADMTLETEYEEGEDVEEPANTPKAAIAAPRKRLTSSAGRWNMLTAFISCMKKYAQFSGRASRAEFWYYELTKTILLLPALFLLTAESPAARITGSIYLVVHSLGLALPTLTAEVRRLHDLALSGWLICLHLIPSIGGLICFVLFCLPSKNKSNPYGEASVPQG